MTKELPTSTGDFNLLTCDHVHYAEASEQEHQDPTGNLTKCYNSAATKMAGNGGCKTIGWQLHSSKQQHVGIWRALNEIKKYRCQITSQDMSEKKGYMAYIIVPPWCNG